MIPFPLQHGGLGLAARRQDSFVVFDSSYVSSPLSLANAGRQVVLAVGSSAVARTVPTLGNAKSSGKWYAEFVWDRVVAGGTTTNGCGVATTDFPFTTAGMASGSGSLYAALWADSTGSAGRIYRSGSFATASGISEPVTGSIVMVAMDVDNRKVWFGVNGTWNASGNPAAGTGESVGSANLAASKSWLPAACPWSSDSGAGNETRMTVRCSASQFSYSPPSGFSPWE